MERYKEERRSILRSKYKAEDYLGAEGKSSDYLTNSGGSAERTKKLSTSSQNSQVAIWFSIFIVPLKQSVLI